MCCLSMQTAKALRYFPGFSWPVSPSSKVYVHTSAHSVSYWIFWPRINLAHSIAPNARNSRSWGYFCIIVHAHISLSTPYSLYWYWYVLAGYSAERINTSQQSHSLYFVRSNSISLYRVHSTASYLYSIQGKKKNILYTEYTFSIHRFYHVCRPRHPLLPTAELQEKKEDTHLPTSKKPL